MRAGIQPTDRPHDGGEAERHDPGHERRQFVAHNLIAAGGTLGAGILGLLLQAIVSHHFNPSEYGKAFAVFSFFALITQPAAGFSRMVVWSTSRELSTGADGHSSAALLRSSNRRLLSVGLVLAATFIVVAPLLAGFLKVPSSYVVLGALGVPFMSATPPLLASLQGEQRFLPWSALSIGMALTKVVCVVLLVIPLGVRGFLLGISLAAAIVYVVALLTVRPCLRRASGPPQWRRMRRFLFVSVMSTVTEAVFLGSDVILVEHYFSTRQAGQFSAVSVTSRALFFAMGSISSVLFPKVAARHARYQRTTAVVGASLGIALAGGLLGLLVFSSGSHVILRSFSGHSYEGGATYIGWYALGMPLLAAVVMLSNTQQSLGRLTLLWALVPGAALKPLLIVLFHGSLLTVALISDLAVALLLAALAGLYLVQERVFLGGPTSAARAEPGPALVMPTASRLGPLRRGIIDRVHNAARGWRERGAWSPRTSWLVDKPKSVICLLAGVGILIRHAWLSTSPLSAGDWHWPDRQRLETYFPWPSIWDSTLGLGGENRFVAAFRFPIETISGLLAHLGAGWTVSEKLVYFVPEAILLPIGGWLLAREIMGRTRWALLTPLLLLGSTYFTLEGDGEIPLALAEVLTLFVLTAFIRAMRDRSMGWSLLSGLLLGLTTAFDVRPAYLCALLMALYLVVLTIAEPSRRVLLRRTALVAAAGAVFLGSQAFWIVPLLTYRGNPGFPTPQAPNFNILTLGHGITGVSAVWTGSQPAVLVQAPLNPVYMVMPMVALMPLLARRLRPEVVWLALAALTFAFFAKTDNPPFGAVYDWMYIHVPGWNLFREGSKFLYVVTMAHAILIPVGLRLVVDWARNLRRRSMQLALRGGVAVALVGVGAPAVATVVVLERGQLASTTVPTPEPASFAALSEILGADPDPGAVLWFGQPLIRRDQRNHHFIIASATHPAVNLTGSFNDTGTNRRDPFQAYCTNSLEPYCYVEPGLFPYLTRVSQTGYVVLPGGSAVGSLPERITRTWLRDQVTHLFGRPQTLGAGDTSLLVWRTPHASTVSRYGAIAVVDSGPWATTQALPALDALGLPAAYRQSFDAERLPPAGSALPDSVAVLPRLDGGCRSSGTGATVGILATAAAPTLTLDVDGAPTTISALSTPARTPGWSVYGPVRLRSGTVPIATTTPGVVLGPCIVWTSLASTALTESRPPGGSAKLSSNGERITAPRTGEAGSWVELRRYFDPGWRLDGRRPDALGDGLFNLYHTSGPGAGAVSEEQFVFEFATVPWERLGWLVALLAVASGLGLAVRDLRRPPPELDVDTALPTLGGSVAPYIAAIGFALLLLTSVAVTAEWFGLPSAAVGTGVADDPYALDVGYGATALALLLVSLVVRCAEPPLVRRITARHDIRRRAAARGAIATLLMVPVLVAAGCASAQNRHDLLDEAELAGQVPPSILGSTLDDARLRRAARQPDLCIADYTAALSIYPTLIAAFSGRGDCYLNGGKNGPAAVHDYSQAISLAPLDPDLHLRRAVAYRVEGNRDAATADYIEAVNNPSANDNQQLTAVYGLLALGQGGVAHSVVADALRRNPSSSTPYVAAYNVAIAADDDNTAAIDLATAQRLASSKPQTIAVATNLCHADVLRHRYQAAVTDCDRAAHLSTNGSGAYDDLAAAHLGLGDLSRALRDIDASIGAFEGSVGPDAQLAGVDGFGLANLFEARGRLDIELHARGAAIEDFRQAIKVLPADAPDMRARLRADIASAQVD